MSVLPRDVVAVGFGVLAALSLSVMAIAIRRGSSYEGGSADEALVVVLGMNIAILLPSALVLYFPDYGLTPRAVLAFVGTGVVGPLSGRLFYFNAIERIGASRTEPLKSTAPPYATVLAVLLLAETVSTVHFLAIVVIVAGIALVSWDLSRSGPGGDSGDLVLSGLLFGLMAALLFGSEPIFAKFGFREGTPAVVGLVIKTATGIVGMTVYGRLAGRFRIRGTLDGPERRWYVLAGLANTGFLVSYYVGLALAPVAIVVPIAQTTPLFVAALSFLFLDDLEEVTLPVVAGAVGIVAGAVTITFVG